MSLRIVRCAAAMLRRVELMVIGGFLVLGVSHTAGAQQRPVTSPPTEAAIAFVNVLSDRKKGLVGLWVGNNSGGDFANFRIVPA